MFLNTNHQIQTGSTSPTHPGSDTKFLVKWLGSREQAESFGAPQMLQRRAGNLWARIWKGQWQAGYHIYGQCTGY